MEKFDDKQPSEEYYLGFDFTDLLGDEDIASAAITIIDTNDSDKDVTATLSDTTNQVNSGKWAYVWIQGGTDDHKYQITCVVTGDGTPPSIYEMEATIKVKELP